MIDLIRAKSDWLGFGDREGYQSTIILAESWGIEHIYICELELLAGVHRPVVWSSKLLQALQDRNLQDLRP